MRNASVFSNFSQHDYRYSTNTKFTVRCTNTYIHTYIHTDTARVQHVNVGLAQARPNKEQHVFLYNLGLIALMNGIIALDFASCN